MADKILYFDPYGKDGMKASLLWDESTDAWNYHTNRPQSGEEHFYYAVPTIFRGVQKIANAVAAMPFVIYSGATEFDKSQEYENKIEWLPHPGTLFGMVSSSLDLTGKSYLRKLGNQAGYVKEMRYYSPLTIEPKYDERAGVLLGFTRSLPTGTIEIPLEEMAYFWLQDPYVELGPPNAYPVKAAMSAAGALMSLDNFVTLYFQRGAVRPMLVFAKGMPQKEERERLESWFNRLMGGIKNAFTWRIFNAESIEAQQIGDGLSELRDIELTKQKRDDVAQALGIPANILYSEAVNFATAQQDKLNFYDDTIVPRCRFIQEVLNEQIFEPMGYSLDFKPETLDIYQEDEAQRAQALVYYTQAGAPLLMAMDILGVELTDEQRAELEEIKQQKDEMREKLANAPPPQFGNQGNDDDQEEQNQPPKQKALMGDLSRWQKKALSALKKGKGAGVEFDSGTIPPGLAGAIAGELEFAQSPEEVKLIFDDIWSGYP